MNITQIIIDACVGALLMGFFSYFGQLYSDNASYIRIVAFMWAMPTLYFYFLFISSRNSKQAMYDFTNHGLIGLLLTLFAMCCTYLLVHYDKNIIIAFNFVFFICVLVWYFYNKIYTLF